MTTRQPPLMPPLSIETRVIKLAEIEPWTTSGARSAINRSMQLLGHQLTDPIVQELPEDNPYRYRVLDGTRRLEHIRRSGEPSIQVKVLPPEAAPEAASAVTIVANLARNTNAVQEARAMQELTDAGWSSKKIAKAVGISPRLVQKRLRLLSLPPEILEATAEGQVRVGVAERIASLRPGEQFELVDLLKKQGRIRNVDVAEHLRTGRAKLLADADEHALFRREDAVPEPEEDAWLREALRAAVDSGYTREALLDLLEEVLE